MRQLIGLAASTNQPIMTPTDIPAFMQKALLGCMQLLSAENFLAIVSRLLGEGSEKVRGVDLREHRIVPSFADHGSLL